MQDGAQDTGMPQVELPKGLSEDFKRQAETATDSTWDDDDDMHVEPGNSAQAVEEHEKGYGAKLPPSVVDFEEDLQAAAAAEKAKEQRLPVERCVFS